MKRDCPRAWPYHLPTLDMSGLATRARGRSLVLLLVGACATDHEVAQKGRQLILGMDTETLQTCAGIPTRTKHLDPHTELYSSFTLMRSNMGSSGNRVGDLRRS
jgi:hypothetical protein